MVPVMVQKWGNRFSRDREPSVSGLTGLHRKGVGVW